MQGQWIGEFHGARHGTLVVELDDRGGYCEGCAFAFQNDLSYPDLFAAIKTPTKDTDFELTLDLKFIDRRSGLIMNWEEIKGQFPAINVEDAKLQTHWSFTDDSLSINSKTGEENETTRLYRGQSHLPSQYAANPDVMTWAQFKEYAITLEPYRYIFRGQENNQWRLRTHFHRSGRFNLLRFMDNDINILHANLSSMTQHVFNLNDQIQNGAFYSLVQHHGYPTPLLDWTYSPFIGSFFAFRKLYRQYRHADTRARIFVFDYREWVQDVPRLQRISPAPPHFSFLSPLAINNTRMVPQQAISTITNVDDIETLIRHLEQLKDKTYLQVIDLPSVERPVVMQELALMGITAGSLFPGLDGACEQLKERFFEM